jgi:hypothetical protein
MTASLRITGLVVAGALLGSAGCGKAAEDPAPAASPKTPAAEPVEETFDPIGTWTVVAHFMPGVSAMNDDAAKAHYGQTLQLTVTDAISSAEHCAAPKYPTRDVPTEAFLASEFNLPPESLKPLEGRDQLTIVEISCNGAPWTAFGSLLLVIDAEHAFTPWDGVFFVLERTHLPAR